jgi:type IV secretion system protein TrbG
MKSVTCLTVVGVFCAAPGLAQDRPTASALKAVQSATRSATVEPSAARFVNGTQVHPFSEGAIFEVPTAPGQVTDIALQCGETLVAVASGDTSRWIVGDTVSGAGEGKRTHVLVKPMKAGLATNLLITTDRRVYHLRLTSTSETALVSMRWTYPQDALLLVERGAPITQNSPANTTGVAVEQLDFGYEISGHKPAWRPVRVFDDGTKTYVEFPASILQREVPPLFTIGADGEPELVNYRMRGRYFVVDRLFDAAELRLGLKKQQVVRIDRVTRLAKRRGA